MAKFILSSRWLVIVALGLTSAGIYINHHQTNSKEQASSGGSTPTLSKDLNVAVRKKAARLFQIPNTPQNVPLKELIEANQILSEAKNVPSSETRDRIARASAKLDVLQKRAKQLGIKMTPAMSEALGGAKRDLNSLAEGKLSSGPSEVTPNPLKISVPESAQKRSISAMSVASASAGKVVTPPPAQKIPVSAKTQAAVISAVPANPSTQTCTDTNPVDPAPALALTNDLYTQQTDAVVALATRLGTPLAAYQFVQNSIKFSGSFGAGQTADQVLKSGSGSSADKASLLIALLRAQGVPAAYMVGELQLTEAQMRSLLGVTSANDLYYALFWLLNSYYGAFSINAIAHNVNGTLIYNFPETWVRAQINGQWIDLDPVNLNNNYTAPPNVVTAVNNLVISLTNWFFLPDAQGNYIKQGTYADLLAQFENPYFQSIFGTGASVSDSSAVAIGQIGGLASNSLPQSVPGLSPCRELETVSLPSTHQYQTTVSVSTNANLFKVTKPAASLRSGTLYLSHSAGLLSTATSATGFLQLKFDDQLLAQASVPTLSLYSLDYQLTFPTRYYSVTMDRPRSFITADVEVINQMTHPVQQSEVTAQAEKILSLNAPSDQRLMAELLRLGALQVMARESRISNTLAALRGVSSNTVTSFTTGTVNGTLQDRSDRALGVVPLGANIDWPMFPITYPRVGGHVSILDYDNIMRYTAELIAAASSLESDVWNELYGLPSISTAAVFQIAADQNAHQNAGNSLISNFLLTPATLSALLAQMSPQMANFWAPTFSSLSTALEGTTIFTTSKAVSLPSGWVGSAVFQGPQTPLGGAGALITTFQFPTLSGSDPTAIESIPLSSTGAGPNSESNSAGGVQPENDPMSASGFGTSGGQTVDLPVPAHAPPVAQGENSPIKCSVGKPVIPATGAMWHEFVDFDVAGRTPSTNLALTRIYLSMPEDLSIGGFGPHWVSNWETHLKIESSSVLWTDEQGGVWKYSGASLTPPVGQFAKLTRLSDRFELRKKNGVVLTFSLNGPEPAGRLRSITDPHGEKVNLSYNSQGQLVTVSSPFAGSIAFTYTAGRITQVLRSRENFAYKYTYDSSGRLVTSTDFANRQTKYTYNASQVGTAANGLLSSITDPIGRQILFTYYNDGRAFTQKAPGGEFLTFLFSPFAGDIHSYVMDSYGAVTEYEFDDQYRLVRQIRDDAATQSFTWTAQNQLATRTDALGYTTQKQYDTNGNLISLKRPADTIPTLIAYDPNFNKVTQIKPALGSQTDFSVNAANGDVLSVQRTLNSTAIATQYSHDAFGNILGVTTNLASYSNQRDQNGFLTQIFDQRNPAKLSYDNRGRVTAVNYPSSGRQLTISYNDFDNITKLTDSAGPTVTYTYDLMQRMTTKTVSGGNINEVTQFTWDERDRLTSVTDPLGNKTSYAYEKTFIGCNVRDLPTAITDPKGNVTKMVYDKALRLVSKTEANGSVTQFFYNQRDDLIAISDPNGHRTTYRFDGNQRLIAQQSRTATLRNGVSAEALSRTEYQYDGVDRLIKKVIGLADGSKPLAATYFTYDDLDRVVARMEQVEQNGIPLAVEDSVNIIYENQLAPTLVKQVSNAHAVDSFTHEFVPPYAATGFGVSRAPAGEKILEGNWTIQPDVTEPFAQVLDLNRDLSLKYTYDPAGRATLVSGSLGHKELKVKSDYDILGRLVKQQSTNVQRTYSYDLANRLISMQKQKGLSEAIVYDAASLITQINSDLVQENFAYDQRNQLIQITGVSNSRKNSSGFSRSFSFDPNGNRLTDSLLGSLTYLDDQILSSPTTSYIPDPTGQGQLAGTDSSLKSESFQYGVNGKVIQYQVQKKLCDNVPCNQLLTAKYLYDGLGRRLQKQIQRSWDSDVIIHNYAYLSDRDEIFLAKNGDADLEDNAHPLTLLVDNQGSTASLSDHLGEVSGKNTTPYELDHLGSVTNSIAADFVSNPRSGYGAFGESRVASIDETTPAVVYGFAGGEYDFESGRYYFRARNYDPQSATFLTKDPKGPLDGGDTNPYRYVRNNPVIFTDPMGLDIDGPVYTPKEFQNVMNGSGPNPYDGRSAVNMGFSDSSVRYVYTSQGVMDMRHVQAAFNTTQSMVNSGVPASIAGATTYGLGVAVEIRQAFGAGGQPSYGQAHSSAFSAEDIRSNVYGINGGKTPGSFNGFVNTIKDPLTCPR